MAIWTTLDNLAAITTANIGTGVAEGTFSYQQALDGDGIFLENAATGVRMNYGSATSVSFNPNEGTADFCYRPNYDADDVSWHTLFHVGAGSSYLELRRQGALSDVACDGAGGAGSVTGNLQVVGVENGDNADIVNVYAAPTLHNLARGEWRRITLSWNFNIKNGEDNVFLFIDGASIPLTSAGSVSYVTIAEPSNDFIDIGYRSGACVPAADFDEFVLYDEAIENPHAGAATP